MSMVDCEKIKKFEEIQKRLWDMARFGNILQSTMSSGLIRELNIESPEGDNPEEA